MCWRNPIGITVWFQFGKLSTNFRTIAAKSERTSNRNDQTQHTAKLDRSMEAANLPRLLHTARRVTLFSQRASQQQQWHYYGWMTFYRISLAVDRGNANGNGKESLSFFLGGGKRGELYEGVWKSNSILQFVALHLQICECDAMSMSMVSRSFQWNSSTISFVTFCQSQRFNSEPNR